MTRSLEQEGNIPWGSEAGFRRRFDSIDREIRKLWAGVNKTGSGRFIDMPFSFSGPPAGAAGDLSAPWVLDGGGETVHFVLLAGVAPTTGPLTVGIYKNGTQFTTVSLQSGEQRAIKPYSEAFDADYDMMQVAFTAFGTGAQDITVQARVRSRR